MVTLPIFKYLDYAHMCAFMCVTATYPSYRLLLGVCVFVDKILVINYMLADVAA